ncbi:MAG TPA: TorF family putative porin [Novosphingobium sp.]|nr:TorF family putative porin [Novosphingobium sp.]HMP55749.1 TorF family putative porin [Novosphingobium sp.]
MLTSIRSLAAATLLAGTALVATPALADQTDPPGEFTISGDVSLVSDYRFRGISLSDGSVAVQGSINVGHASGFYVGTWASSIEDSPVYGHTEVDLFAGWSGDIAPGLTADVGVTYFVYPNGRVGKANYWEPYASLSAALGPVTAKVGVAYAWDQKSLGSDDNLYIYTDLEAGIPDTPITLAAHLGYTDGALSPEVLTGKGTGGGFDWSLGASFAITPNLSIGATYVGVEGNSFKRFSNDTVVATLSLSF